MKQVIVGQDERVGPWVCERTGGTWIPGRGSTIGLEEDGELIAGTLYEDYNGANVNVHLAGIGKKWLNREFLWFCFYYPFEQLKVKRLTGIVPSCNDDAMRFDLHIGFRHETTLKDAHPKGDIHILVMRREDCRWLERNHVRK